MYKNSYTQKNGKVKKVIERVLCYRHSDGYPEGVVPDMIRFLKWNRGRNTDLEYLVANWIYFEKKGLEQYVRDDNPNYAERKPVWVTYENLDTIDTSTVQLSYGVCQPKSLHGDIEYFYRVTIDPKSEPDSYMTKVEITIEVYETRFNLEYKDLDKIKPSHTLKFDDEINAKDNTNLVLAKIMGKEN